MTLTTHHLEFTATAVTDLELDAQAGSAVRGAIVGALWDRFCTNQAAPTCADCPLLKMCPVAALVAPMREEGETGGAQRPRPYVIQPPSEARRYAPGEPFTFGLSLFGPAALLFPYLVLAAQSIEQSGLGRRLASNAGRRGALRLETIAAADPLHGARQILYQRGHSRVQAPGLPVSAGDVAAYAAALPDQRITLQFLTPLRLIDQKQLVRVFALRPFIQRLKERLDQLMATYGDPPQTLPRSDFAQLAEAVQIIDDQTRWLDVSGYSSRQQRSLPLGGLVGSVTLAGVRDPLREWLVWGSLIHVGKNAVKGDGWYRLTLAR